uniref:Uncharacterized protein n=1 Tax=Panagrolaimus sp. ES5 TaxID=591445 RepID=A0AC34GCJ1_9BILA
MASYSGDRGEKNYVAYIDSDNCENDIRVSAIDVTTQEPVDDYYERIPTANVKQFFNDIPSKFRGFKAVILSVFGFHSDEYKNNLEFRNAIREKLQLINVQFQFIKMGTMMYSIPLCAAGITLSVGENIVTATLIRSNFDLINFVLTENGYIIFSNRRSIPYDENEDVKDIREKLTRDFNPKELIIVADGDDQKKLEKMKDAHFVTCSCYTLTKYTYQLLIDYIKWMLDKTSAKTLLAPVVDNHYVLTKFLGDKQQREDLVVDSRQLLPVSKTLLLPKSKCTFGATCIDRYVEKPVTLLVVMKKDENRLVISAFPKTSVETIKQDEKYHGIKFTFELDINN